MATGMPEKKFWQEFVWLGGAKVAVLWAAFPDLQLSSSLFNIISAFVDSFYRFFMHDECVPDMMRDPAGWVAVG